MNQLIQFAPLLVATGTFMAVVLAWLAVSDRQPQLATAAGVPTGMLSDATEKPSALHRLAQALAAPRDEASRSHMREWLVQAGWRERHNLEHFVALRAALAILLPLLGWSLIQPERLMATGSLVLALAAVGYYGPTVVLWQLRLARLDRLSHAFPNALDMLVSVLEGGLGVDAALIHVARELPAACPELASEIDTVNLELAAGVPRLEALNHLYLRTGLDDIASLVNVLAQAERYGSGIAQSIRAHAQLTRRHRANEAETRAAKASPKLTVAMIFFILPPLFVVLLGPTIVHVVERLLPTLAGQIR